MFCSLVRWQLSSALDRQGPPSRRTAAHLAQCAGCRAHADRLMSLHRRLEAGARAAVPPLAAGPGAARRPARPSAVRAALVLTAGAAAAVLLFRAADAPEQATPAVARSESAAPPVEPGTELAPDAPDAPGSLATPADPASTTPGDADRPSRNVVGQLGVLFRAPAPLRAEIAAIAADGKRGALAILDLGGVRNWARP